MKRIVVALALWGVLGSAVPAAQAGDYGSYGYPPASQDHPILRKILVGAGIFGVGFLAGRLTAPKPNSNYGYYPPTGGQPYPGSWNRPPHGHGRAF